MICPQCKEQGLMSTVETGGCISTLVSYPTYYDENGERHHHDNNKIETNCRCSMGHLFGYIYENNCWCGWVGRKEEYIEIKEITYL